VRHKQKLLEGGPGIDAEDLSRQIRLNTPGIIYLGKHVGRVIEATPEGSHNIKVVVELTEPTPEEFNLKLQATGTIQKPLITGAVLEAKE
jgi:hypothetical protein